METNLRMAKEGIRGTFFLQPRAGLESVVMMHEEAPDDVG